MRLHLLDVIRGEAISSVERESGGLSGLRDLAVGFVDLVGFTAFAESAAQKEVGSIAERFEALVFEHAAPPVRLVKLLGDGAMLVCEQPAPLLEAILAMRDEVHAADLPALHAGVTYGPCVRNGGDFYGRTVNLAARLSAHAPSGVVLVDSPLARHDLAGLRFEAAGEQVLKGIEGAVEVFSAARVPEPEASTGHHGGFAPRDDPAAGVTARRSEE